MQQEHSEVKRVERCEAFLRSNFFESPPPKRKKRVLVTLSRQAYSRAHEVGECLMTRLEADPAFGKDRWALFDKRLVKNVLESHELPETLSQYMPEDREHSLSSLINEIVGLHPSLWELFHHTCDTILKLASRGNVILVGRGSHVLTRHFEGAVHARIVAPFEMRAKRASSLRICNYKEACHRVHHEDHCRAAYLRSHFNESIDDPVHYDVVLNTGRMTPDEAAEMLHTRLRRVI